MLLGVEIKEKAMRILTGGIIAERIAISNPDDDSIANMAIPYLKEGAFDDSALVQLVQVANPGGEMDILILAILLKKCPQHSDTAEVKKFLPLWTSIYRCARMNTRVKSHAGSMIERATHPPSPYAPVEDLLPEELTKKLKALP
ncbi:MAG: hypothetical protein JWO50_169 [Candidatus Kaiserbacteria bacterium]|nr:hypothetical protein [Candidatus Kaiserbacteria bacterium]